MKRVLIFALCSPKQKLPTYQIQSLNTLKTVYSRLVIVSAGRPNAELIESCKHLGEVLFTGLSAPSYWTLWREGLITLGWTRHKDLEEVHLLHDRCVGPLTNPANWSLPDDPDKFLRTREFYGLHTPCSFMAFGTEIIRSDEFSRFWNHEVPTELSADESVQSMQELRKLLTEAGFVDGFVTDMEGGDEPMEIDEIYEPELMADVLLRNRFPFIDLDSIYAFPHPDYFFGLMRRQSHYDTREFEQYLCRELTPNEQIRLLNKNVLLTDSVKSDVPATQKFRVGVHIHVYYVDVALELIARLSATGIRAELILTSDAQSKLDRLLIFAPQWGDKLSVRQSTVLMNRGRDMLPWVMVSSGLAEYDLVGHFHTKKTTWSDAWFGASWMDELMDTLVDPAAQILEMFEQRQELGIVIPDIPYVYKMKPRVDAWGKNRGTCATLWKRMGRKQSVDFESLDVPVMPYGNMFWYRPEALAPIHRLGITPNEFDSEPLPVDGTLAHALERMHVYVAWSEGYDFRVLMSPRHVRSTMDLYERASVTKTIISLKKQLKSL